MKYLFILFLFLISCNQTKEFSDIDKEVDDILKSMTLDEKVGQMTQINLTVIAKGPNKWKSKFPLEISPKRAKKALIRKKYLY